MAAVLVVVTWGGRFPTVILMNGSQVPLLSFPLRSLTSIIVTYTKYSSL